MSPTAGRRTALLVATDVYGDPAFKKLAAPRQDAKDLASVLGDPDIGGFTVTVLENVPTQDVRVRLNEQFAQADRDDLVLLYFSCHGIKDEAGNLYLAMTDTRRSLLAATAVSAQFVREIIDHSPARKIVVWLDCCYGGAFPPGMVPKAEGNVDVVAQLNGRSGRGCAVMTASTHIQYAYEKESGADSGALQASVFTSVIVQGLRSGAADLDQDGEIDAAELYSYVYDHVRLVAPDQTPTRNDQLNGGLYIARSRLGLKLPPGIDPHIRTVLRSPYRQIRISGIRQLGEMAAEGDQVAATALFLLSESSDPVLTQAAAEALYDVEHKKTRPAQARSSHPLSPVQGLGSRPIAIGTRISGRDAVVDFASTPHFVMYAAAASGKTNLLRTIVKGVCDQYSSKEAVIILVDYRRTMLGFIQTDHLLGYAVSSTQLTNMVKDAASSLHKRQPSPNVTQKQLRDRSWWRGPELFLVIDDYDLVSTQDGNPLAPLVEFLPPMIARDVGLHVVIARNTAGARYALRSDDVLRTLFETGVPGLVGSGEPREGHLIGQTAPNNRMPGKATMVAQDGTVAAVRLTWTQPDQARPNIDKKPPRPQWAHELTLLDEDLAGGRISAHDYRTKRDQLLRRATQESP